MRNNFEKPEEKEKKSLVDNSGVKKAALVAAVALVGIGNINAQEGNSNEKTNTIEAQATEVKINKENTYFANAEDFNEKNKVSDAKPLEIKIEKGKYVDQLEVGNYFDTDLYNLEKNREMIEKSIRDNILSQITPENIKKFLNDKKSILTHSDERLTNRYEGGNEELSYKRGEEIKRIIEELFRSYKYGENFSTDDVEKLKSTTFEIIPYVSKTGPEKGVVYLTDVINPATGKNFTPIEVKELKNENSDLYYKLLRENRKVTILIGVGKTLYLQPIIPNLTPNQPSPELAGVPTFEIPPKTPSETPTVVKHKPTKESHSNFRVKRFKMPEKYKTKKCVSPKSNYKKHR